MKTSNLFMEGFISILLLTHLLQSRKEPGDLYFTFLMDNIAVPKVNLSYWL